MVAASKSSSDESLCQHLEIGGVCVCVWLSKGMICMGYGASAEQSGVASWSCTFHWFPLSPAPRHGHFARVHYTVIVTSRFASCTISLFFLTGSREIPTSFLWVRLLLHGLCSRAFVLEMWGQREASEALERGGFRLIVSLVVDSGQGVLFFSVRRVKRASIKFTCQIGRAHV